MQQSSSDKCHWEVLNNDLKEVNKPAKCVPSEEVFQEEERSQYESPKLG